MLRNFAAAKLDLLETIAAAAPSMRLCGPIPGRRSRGRVPASSQLCAPSASRCGGQPPPPAELGEVPVRLLALRSQAC